MPYCTMFVMEESSVKDRHADLNVATWTKFYYVLQCTGLSISESDFLHPGDFNGRGKCVDNTVSFHARSR